MVWLIDIGLVQGAIERGQAACHLMHRWITSRIMRTTIDIDDPILKDLKRLQRRQGKSLGRLVSDLLARSLADERATPSSHDAPTLNWISRSMHARVDLADKDSVWRAMDDVTAS
jgi:Arc/MetJ family transcription regulator